MYALIDPDQDIDDRPHKVEVEEDDSDAIIEYSQCEDGALDIKSAREEIEQEREAEECHRHDSLEDEQWA